MKGKKITPILGLMGMAALACAAPNYNTPQNNSSQYQQEYEQKYEQNNTDSDGDGLSDYVEKNEYHTNPLDKDSDKDGLFDKAEITMFHTNPIDYDTDNDGYSDGDEAQEGDSGTDPNDPKSFPQTGIHRRNKTTTSSIITKRTLSVEEMLAVKKKIEKADQYIARNLPGNALVQLLEAQESAGMNNFRNELEPRIKETVAELTDELDLYKINVNISDKTQSGKAEQIKYALVAKVYVSGIEPEYSGGNYTLTLDMHSIGVDNKVSSLSHVILIPTGSTKTLNGQFVALQQKVEIECKDYFAERDAARGSGVQTAVGAWNLINALNSESIAGTAESLIQMGEGIDRSSRGNTAEVECKGLEEKLEATPMYTSDTQTTPFQYEEVITRKWATLDFRLSLTSAAGTILYASPPLELEFVRENVKRPNIPAANIQGSAGEEISNKEVMQGVVAAIDDELYEQIDKGAVVWDLITAFQAKQRTGEGAVEAYMQLAFHAHARELKGAAVLYFSGYNPKISAQLAEIVEAQ